MRRLIRVWSLAIACLLLTGIANAVTPTQSPPAARRAPLNLSLHEAILLATRGNPNVQTAQLSYVMEKFNVWVQEWQFLPHYSLQASATGTRTGSNGQPITGSHNYNVTPAISLTTPIGTTVSLTATNPDTGHYNPGLSAQIMQPLMRGFGTAIVEQALFNARDSEGISKLNIEGTLRATVTAVINAYLDIVSAEKTIQIDEGALKRAEKSVEQTQLYIKAGHKAGNEIITVKANVASAKSQLENDRNNLTQARYALLTAIGLDPNTPVIFGNLDVDKLITKYHKMSLDDAKHKILANNIQYQVEQITFKGAKMRSLALAEDNTRWQLNLSANAATGSGSSGGQNAGIDSVFNGANQSQSVGLTLQIPIDDQMLKQGVVNAKIALEQAQLALMKEKWDIETSAINGWNSVISAESAMYFAEDAEKLQEKTYNVSYQKYLHGLIDSLELQSALVSLIQSQQALLNARINYLKGLVNLDLLIGNTLNTWDVQVRL